jgi:hypothetical protein
MFIYSMYSNYIYKIVWGGAVEQSAYRRKRALAAECRAARMVDRSPREAAARRQASQPPASPLPCTLCHLLQKHLTHSQA